MKGKNLWKRRRKKKYYSSKPIFKFLKENATIIGISVNTVNISEPAWKTTITVIFTFLETFLHGHVTCCIFLFASGGFRLFWKTWAETVYTCRNVKKNASKHLKPPRFTKDIFLGNHCCHLVENPWAIKKTHRLAQACTINHPTLRTHPDHCFPQNKSKAPWVSGSSLGEPLSHRVETCWPPQTCLVPALSMSPYNFSVQNQ